MFTEDRFGMVISVWKRNVNMKIVNKQIILYSCLWILPVHTQNNIEQVFANYQGVKIKWFVERKKSREPPSFGSKSH